MPLCLLTVRFLILYFSWCNSGWILNVRFREGHLFGTPLRRAGSLCFRNVPRLGPFAYVGWFLGNGVSRVLGGWFNSEVMKNLFLGFHAVATEGGTGLRLVFSWNAQSKSKDCENSGGALNSLGSVTQLYYRRVFYFWSLIFPRQLLFILLQFSAFFYYCWRIWGFKNVLCVPCTFFFYSARCITLYDWA